MICNSIFVFQLVLCVPGLSDPEGENEVLDRTEEGKRRMDLGQQHRAANQVILKGPVCRI